MELILNDRSLHGQFGDIPAFQHAIVRIMVMRESARLYGRDLQCHRNVVNAQVTPQLSMPQAIRTLSKDRQRSLMQWLTKFGPFWEDDRQHSGEDDLLECEGEIVTDTAIGEAAYCLLHGVTRSLVSLTPSSWSMSPISVDWHEERRVRNVAVPNFWDADDLRASLESSPVGLRSWKDLEQFARSRYTDLVFADDSFASLAGHPFGEGPAERILLRLSVLHDLRNSFGAKGEWSPEGHTIYQKHFVGEKAWFSDSSDKEKSDFRSALTFRHPAKVGEWLFCTWHGKVKTPQLRIHFSWPIRSSEPLYIVYVGPKITKR